LAVAARNAAYHAGWLAVDSASVPVVSVGNLTLGGTGKTPLVAWVARQLAAAGVPPAIVSRGYGAKPGETSDEAAELAILLPDVPHVANRSRAAGARTAASLGARVIVLDDGFQHRRLARDLDIVAIDATDPFGCDRLFPRGLLREPVAGLARAGGVVLTRADAVDEDRRRQIRATVERACGAPPTAWAEAVHRPARLRRFSGPTLPLADLRGQRVFAAAGIGNPAAFRRTLGTLGPSIAGCRWFADHHAYADQDLEEVAAAGRDAGCDLIVTTLKDLVKIRSDELAGLPVVALEIALEMISGGDDIGAAIDRAIAGDVGVHR
jgi:tetraacyldisaccharide 4'-kinase